MGVSWHGARRIASNLRDGDFASPDVQRGTVEVKSKYVLCDRNVHVTLKGKIYRTVVWPTLVYGDIVNNETP